MSVKILVTGSNGQLGKCIEEIHLHFPQFTFDFKSKNILDITNRLQLKSLLESKYDYIINTAAYTKVDHAEHETDQCFAINYDGVRNIAELSPSSTKIIHISSDYVYHFNPGRPFFTHDKTYARSIYAKSKLAGDSVLLEKRPDSIIIRTSWVYSHHGNNFVKTMLRLGQQNSTLRIVSDQHGSPTYAMNMAEAILRIIDICAKQKNNKKQPCGVYHYSNSGVTNWAEFANEIFKQSTIDCEVSGIRTLDYPTPAIRPLWSHLSKQSTIDDFQIDLIPWKKALKECLNLIGH